MADSTKRSLSPSSNVERQGKRFRSVAPAHPSRACQARSSSPQELIAATSVVDQALKIDPYQLHPLDHTKTQIRIFTLLPSANRGAALLGQIRVIDLSIRPPKYEALSYVWGEADQKHELSIATGVLNISTNLFEALSRLRNPTEPRDLWIDAICIDQKTASEKNHQVRQMYNIYSQSWRVLVWLGEGDEDSDYAMSRLGKATDKNYYLSSLSGLETIFARPWWRRVWTLQEGFAAGSYSRVVCGSKSASWEVLLRSFHSRLSFFAQRRNTDVGEFIRAYTKHQTWSTTLEDLFWSSTTREATDSRDYIYALLGPIDPSLKTPLQPNYAKSESWAYQMAMMVIMAEAGHLDFLLLRVLRNDLMKPSWCLDFSQTDELERQRDLVKTLHDQSPEGEYTPRTQQLSFDPMQLFRHNYRQGTITLVGRKIDEVMLSCKRDGRNHACLLARSNQPHYQCTDNCSFSHFTSMYKQNLRDLHLDGEISTTPRRARTQQVRFKYKRWYDRWLGASEWLFGTTAGRVGFATASLHQGDIVCTLYGSLLPLVLRPDGDGTYSIVGIVAASGTWNETRGIELEKEFSSLRGETMVNKLGDRGLDEGDRRFVII